MQKYEQFKNLIQRIFENYDYNVEISDNNNKGYDLVAENKGSKVGIELKYSKNKMMRSDMIYNTVIRLSDISADMQPMVVCSGYIDEKVREKAASLGKVKLIDITNLLYLVNNLLEFKDELLSLLEFSTSDIIPGKPENFLFNSYSEDMEDRTKKDSPISELKNWNNKEHTFVEYEDICIRALKQLFADELTLWGKQEKSNANLYRFDLICKIKDEVENGLWTFLQQFFNTKYIIFEFKNYADQISQKEIYTTEKYLYSKALRGVAILISCKGEDANAQKAIRGTLRENGKLILSINNDDLINMLELKENNDVASDYLYSKLDDMLVDLEK